MFAIISTHCLNIERQGADLFVTYTASLSPYLLANDSPKRLLCVQFLIWQLYVILGK